MSSTQNSNKNSIFSYLLSSKNHYSLLLIIGSFPLVFLSIRHGIHVSLFLLLGLALVNLFTHPKNYLHQLQDKSVRAIFLSMTAIFFATLITQFLQGTIVIRDYDGPSKILCAALVFLYLNQQKISIIKVLEWAIPLSSMVVLATIFLNPETSQFWGGRFASKFVDPNSLGSQATILGLLCLVMIKPIKNESSQLLVLKLLGGLIYLYISIFAGSRGGWLAVIPFLVTWIALKVIDHQTKRFNSYRTLITTSSILLLVIICTFLLYQSETFLSQRVVSGYSEIRGWLSGENTNTSAGVRLTMWKISLNLFQLSPWWGLGALKPDDFLNSSIIDTPANVQVFRDILSTGPHSDILVKLLSNGLIGLAAYIATIFIPAYVFWTNKHHQNPDSRMAARIGCYYVVGLFFCGLTNEMMSLKYLNSFYGLMLACLAAQTLNPFNKNFSYSKY